MEKSITKIGIGVAIIKGGKILLGKRKNAHGAGEWAPPGGHLEYMESFEDCVKRETREETGCEVTNINFLRIYREKEHAPKDYVNIIFTADIVSGEPKIMEPDKCEAWQWFEIENLPTPLYGVMPSLIQALKTGQTCFDA